MSKLIIGDVHGKFNRLKEIVGDGSQHEHYIQLGDLGVGFPDRMHPRQLSYPQGMPDNFRFFRGNHDNPGFAAACPHFLGEYGMDNELGFFYVGGAWSIDKDYRTPGVTWWESEQLSYEQLINARDEYIRAMPRVMITHECPPQVFPMVCYGKYVATQTSAALGDMLNAHRPDIWIFGHYHEEKSFTFHGCRFTCLAELGTKVIP